MAAVLGFLLAMSGGAAGAVESRRPTVLVDPRVELLAVIHVLAAEQAPLRGFKLSELAYAQDVSKRFGRFRDHEAVKRYRKAVSSGFDLVSAFRLMMHSSLPPRLKARIKDIPKEQAPLLESFSAFAEDSDFMGFFDGNKTRYEEFAALVAKQLVGRDYVSMLEKYSGLPVTAEYAIVVCPLCDEAESVNILDRKGDSYRIISSMGPERIENGAPVFDYLEFRLGLWHEFSHTLLDGRQKDFEAKIRDAQPLFETVADCCRGSWDECVRENVVQGVAYGVWNWTRAHGLVNEGPVRLRQNKELPFIPQIVARLKEFEAKRGTGMTLADFYPRLIDVFSELNGSRDPQARRSSACGAHSSL